MAIDHSKPPCPECGSYDAESHAPFCSRITPEQKIRQITLWTGKFLMVVRENNTLRRKLYPPSKNKKPRPVLAEGSEKRGGCNLPPTRPKPDNPPPPLEKKA